MNCLSKESKLCRCLRFVSMLGLILFLVGIITWAGKDSVDARSEGLKIHFISVGQADATLIECDGHYAMIDCGKGNGTRSDYRLAIDKCLEREEAEYFDYIFCSHYDKDHYDGFVDILEKRKFKTVYGPSGFKEIDNHSMNSFKNFLRERKKKIKTPKKGKKLELGSAEIEVLSVDAGNNRNDASLVLMLTYKDTRFLFMGDAEKKTEQDILDSGFDVKCDVIKVAHHGSSTSSSPAFLDKAKPKYAIMSVEANRKLPEGTVIDNFESINAKILRTDEKGTISCESDGKNIIIKNSDGKRIN